MLHRSFPIAFRRGWSDWQQRDPATLAKWASENGFAAIDLMKVSARDFQTLWEHHLQMGSVDLLDFPKIMSGDSGERKAIIEKNVQYVRETTALGAKIFFTCVIPADPAKPRGENYALAVECFSPIGQACNDAGAWLVIEGYPGPLPHQANLCSTPETLRPFLNDVPGSAVNYDPSHLVRLGVDHIRFLKEFAPHVRHVHAKDTLRYPDAQYEVGDLTGAFSRPHGFGAWTWRYCLPGKGQTRWREMMQVLADSRYAGLISIELEDEEVNGDESREKQALIEARAFLEQLN